MKTASDSELIETNLGIVLSEMEAQPEVARHFPPNVLAYGDLMAQIHEFIDLAGEYGLAYEYINGALETLPFKISGNATVKLLEVGLLMGFKSGLDRDKRFDRRSST